MSEESELDSPSPADGDVHRFDAALVEGILTLSYTPSSGSRDISVDSKPTTTAATLPHKAFSRPDTHLPAAPRAACTTPASCVPALLDAAEPHAAPPGAASVAASCVPASELSPFVSSTFAAASSPSSIQAAQAAPVHDFSSDSLVMCRARAQSSRTASRAKSRGATRLSRVKASRPPFIRR